jgi:hypothetical protein
VGSGVGTAVPAKTISTSGGGSIAVAAAVGIEVAGTVVAVVVALSACGDLQLTKSSVRKRVVIMVRERFLPVKRIVNWIIR